MIFAALHAALGCALAALACLAFRKRPADVRCWAWRLGLLKGPLALVLSVPVFLLAPLPALKGEIRTAPPIASVPAVLPKSGPPVAVVGRTPDPILERRAPTVEKASVSPKPLVPAAAPLPLAWVLYSCGLFCVLVSRLLAACRLPRGGPRVVGVLRPRVVVPEGLAPDAAAMAHAHETAHVRRRDPQWSLVAEAVCLAFWFVPPVWLAARAMRAEAEAACDAETLRATAASRQAYARLLLDHAGPAPALALGGPARRLARRILMLENTPKPLPRLAVAATLALGLAALLPWRAEAQTAPIRAEVAMREPLPVMISLENGMRYVFSQPGVKAAIGWTPAQEAALRERTRRYDAVWLPVKRESDRIKRTRPLDEHSSFALKEARAQEMAETVAGPIPWTVAQATELKRRALVRLGGALWLDKEIVTRLALTAEQRRLVGETDSKVLHQVMDLVPKTPPFPKKVHDLIVWTTAKYFAAMPKDRQRYRDQTDRLVKKYRKRPIPTRDEERRLATGPEAWSIRAQADRRLEAALTSDQRTILQRLRTDPSAWRAEEGRAMPFAPTTLVPARASLGAAMRRQLKEPGTVVALGLTPDQEATLELSDLKRSLALDAERKRAAISNLKKFPQGSRAPMAQANRIELANVTKEEAAIRRQIAETNPTTLTDAQRRKLASLALQKYGSALWEDPLIADALGLTEAQINAVRVRNDAIAAAQRSDRSSGEFGGFVANIEARLRKGGLSASERKQLESSLRGYRDMADRLRPMSQEDEPRFWRMRGAADALLEAELTPMQRERLARLRRDPQTWPEVPLDMIDAGSFDHLQVSHLNRVAMVWSDAKAAKRRALQKPSIQGTEVMFARGMTYVSADATFDGRRLDAMTFPEDPKRPLVLSDKEKGSMWRVFRTDDEPGFRYRIVRVP